jgi:glycosyltransferase involved in cell wall biosynthesis
VKKYKVAFVQYDKLEPSSGIGNVCKQFNDQLSQFKDIELYPLCPPILHSKSLGVILKIVNSMLFVFWYRVILPIRVYIYRADLYIELNMLVPSCFLRKVSFLVYDLAFVHFRNVVTKRNYRRRIKFLNHLPKSKLNHLVISKATENDLIAFTAMDQNRFSVCHLASMFKNISNERMILDNCEGYFLFVGTIEPRKNIVEIIKAFYLFLNNSKANYRLIMIGKMGWLMDELGDTLNICPKTRELIEFIGYVDDHTLSCWYGGAKALVFPSLYEGFGLPILEAMAHNIPVITCRNSSLVEVGGDAVLYTDPDGESIAEAMQNLWADPLLAEELINKGKLQLKKFSWENFGKCVHESILSNVKVK